MASVLFLSLILFLSLPSATRPQSPDQPTTSSVPPEIHQACKATRFPIRCENALTQSKRVPSNPTTLQLIQAAISVSSDKLHIIQSMVNSILESSAGSQNRTIAAKSCVDFLHNCDYRLQTASEALPHGRVKDARAWTSAALIFQYDCWATLNRTADTKMVNETIALFELITKLTSNAISMVFAYDVYGKDTKSWAPPKTERGGLWERNEAGGGSTASFNGGVPKNLKADVTVCKDATKGGCYKTVQEAVNAAPDNGGKRRFVTHIKEGVYEETVRVPLEKKNVVFLGDGMGKTVITGSLNVGQPGISTYGSATVGVIGDGFMAAWLTIQNTAGPDTHQAVAFRSDSDLSVIEKYEFLGNQDTLYPHSLRQFYKSCSIQGNVDFIFGNSTVVFLDSQILVRPRQVDLEKGENNAVTAHGRNDPAQATGFVFQNCVINGTNEYMALYYKNPQVHKSYLLGRPWKEYSRSIFLNYNIESLITLEGWLPWTGDVGLKTLYYGEAGNSGRGSNLSKRVTWSSRIPAEHIYVYIRHRILSREMIGFRHLSLVSVNLGMHKEYLQKPLDVRLPILLRRKIHVRWWCELNILIGRTNHKA